MHLFDALNALKKDIRGINVQPQVNLEPILDDLRLVRECVNAIDVVPQLEPIQVNLRSILKAIQNIDIKPQVHEEVQSLVDAVEKIEVRPVVDTHGILEAIAKV